MNNNITPLKAARAITPRWLLQIWEFDALEIHPCAIIGQDSTGRDIVETCDPQNTNVWTVYGHCRAGGVDDFEEFATQDAAWEFRDWLISLYPHLSGWRAEP